MKQFYLLLIVIGGLYAGTAHAQLFTYIPPENFIPDSATADDNTWINKSAGSVIQITATGNSSYFSFEKSFSDEQLTGNNLVIKEKRSAQVTQKDGKSQPSMVFVCSYTTVSEDGTKPVEYTRIICFTGNDSLMIMAVATIPAMAESVMLDPVLVSFEKNLIIQ